MIDFDILPELVEGFASNILAYAVLLAAIATVTMTLLELTKAVLGLRARYHERRVRAWMSADERCFRELLILTVAEESSARALFDQPTDKMMGQIQAATNVAIDFPHLYGSLYRFITAVPASDAAAKETGGDGRTRGSSSDAGVWEEFARGLEEAPPAGASSDSPAGRAGIERATRARARLDHFVTRKLDAFQTRTEYLWARSNQSASVLGTAVFILVLLERSGLSASPAQTFFLAAFGGMLAPFAKDVVSALTGLRARA